MALPYTVTPMLKAVIFDFGQTLVDSADGFRTAEKEAQGRLFAHLGLSLQDDFMVNYRRIRKNFQDRSDFSRKSIWHAVYHYYGLTPDPDLLEKWENEYWETVKAHTTLFPEVENVLQALSRRYRVALISNTQGQRATGTHRLSQFPDLETFFEVIIIAGEGNIPPKPDPEPFRLCLEKLQIAAPEAVYVGDDWRIDICGARDAGLHPVWLKHHSVRRNWPEGESSIEVITTLEALLNLENILH